MTIPIVAICPGRVVTGGPEALHQLIDMVNCISPHSGYICYTPFDQHHGTPETYAGYKTPNIRKDDIPDNAVIVLPEIFPDLIEEFVQRCAFWWLSVDSFYAWSGDTTAMRQAAVQLAQSEYARRHLAEKFGINSLMLTDYISRDFENVAGIIKHPRVAVNPTKGRDLIDQFCERFPDIEVVELIDMSREQVRRVLAESTIYIDFGHHPGRDRLPREAALSRVVILSTNVGSAANEIDMPLNDWYKFDSVDHAGEKVRAIFGDANSHLKAQESYYENVAAQRAKFRLEVEQLIRFAETETVK